MSWKKNEKKNRERCIKKGKQYDEETNERLQKMASDQYTGLSDMEKDKKGEYTKNRYQKMPEEDKQKLREHKKNRIFGITQQTK